MEAMLHEARRATAEATGCGDNGEESRRVDIVGLQCRGDEVKGKTKFSRILEFSTSMHCA